MEWNITLPVWRAGKSSRYTPRHTMGGVGHGRKWKIYLGTGKLQLWLRVRGRVGSRVFFVAAAILFAVLLYYVKAPA